MSDTIDGLLALMDADVATPVNIGDPDERTIEELTDLIVELTGGEAGVTYERRPPQDPDVRRPDIRKARATIDWEPTVSLRAGLERSIAHFSRQLEAEPPR